MTKALLHCCDHGWGDHNADVHGLYCDMCHTRCMIMMNVAIKKVNTAILKRKTGIDAAISALQLGKEYLYTASRLIEEEE